MEDTGSDRLAALLRNIERFGWALRSPLMTDESDEERGTACKSRQCQLPVFEANE